MIKLGDEYIYRDEVTTVSLITPTGMVRLRDDPMRILFKPSTGDYDVLIDPRQAAYDFRDPIRQRAHRATPERLRTLRDEARLRRLRDRLRDLGIYLEEAWAKPGGEPLEPTETHPEKVPTDA